MCDKKHVIEDTLAIIGTLNCTDELDAEIAERQAKMDEISNAAASMVRENARTAQDKLDFSNKYEALTKQYEVQKNSLDKMVKENAYKTDKTTKMRAYFEAMKQADDYIEEWSDEAWIQMVEKATVNRDKTITFKFVKARRSKFSVGP